MSVCRDVEGSGREVCELSPSTEALVALLVAEAVAKGLSYEDEVLDYVLSDFLRSRSLEPQEDELIAAEVAWQLECIA